MISTRMDGAQDLVRALASLSQRASRSLLREALLAVGEPMRQNIAQRAARAPGLPDLADNIQIAQTRVGEQGDVSVGIGVPKQFFYDYFLEYGTVKMSAQPLYRPTFDSMVNRAIEDIGDVIWTELAGKGISRPTSVASQPVSHFGPFL